MQECKPQLWTRSFIGIVIINLVLFLANQLQLSTLPIYLKGLSNSDSIVGLSTILSTLAAMIIRPFAGLAIDKFGRHTVFLTGITLLMASLFMYTILKFVTAILVIRFFFGIAWGISTTSSNTIATDVIPKDRFGEGMGYFSLSQSISLALAPVIGLILLNKIEFSGLSITSIFLLITTVIFSYSIRYTKPKNEKRSLQPYESGAIRPAIIMVFVGIGIGATFCFIVLYGKSMEFNNVGLFFTFYAVSLLITRPLIGYVIDRFGLKFMMVPGFVGFISSMLILFLTHSQTGFLFAALLQGISYGSLQTSIQTMAVINSPENRRGAANATYLTGSDIGVGIGGLTAGVMSTYFGYSNMFGGISFILVIGVVVYFLILRKFEIKSFDSTEEAVSHRYLRDM